ncbi:hypothetical protein I4U23_016289 [Adineta vaga]|nr:hypothetical protein I4U23_016289 [Adineta vaga]
MANSLSDITKTINTNESDSDIISPTVSTNELSSTPEKIERPKCHGNPCPRCGKYCDSYYTGDFDRDSELFSLGLSYTFFNPDNWYRRPNGPSVTCSYYAFYHFGSHSRNNGFDFCRCK